MLNEIFQFTNALHKTSNEKLIALLERLEDDEWELENNYTMYEMALEEAQNRGIR